MSFSKEYRNWMIAEINNTLNNPLVDTDQMTTEYLESLLELTKMNKIMFSEPEHLHQLFEVKLTAEQLKIWNTTE